MLVCVFVCVRVCMDACVYVRACVCLPLLLGVRSLHDQGRSGDE